MSKFDAVIRILRKYIGGDPDDLNRELYAAIRLLQAAAKVDKELCLMTFDHIFPLEYASFPMIHELLASLPDKEDK